MILKQYNLLQTKLYIKRNHEQNLVKYRKEKKLNISNKIIVFKYDFYMQILHLCIKNILTYSYPNI